MPNADLMEPFAACRRYYKERAREGWRCVSCVGDVKFWNEKWLIG